MTEIDGELGQALKGLLTSILMDDFDGNIRSQNVAIAQRGEAIADFSEDDAPMGFPILSDTGDLNLLQYLDKHRILTFEEQLNLAADNISEKGSRKLNSATRKRLSKIWKGNYDGSTRDLEILLTQLILHPITRTGLVGNIKEQSNWRKDPVVKMLITAHNWLGYDGSIMAVKDFLSRYETADHFWPLEIWEAIPVDEFGRTDEEGMRLAKAFEGFLIALLASAQDWENLTDQQRKGVILGAHAVSSLMLTRVVLAPFDAVIPNFRDVVMFEPIIHVGLCDSKGNPSAIFELARSMAVNIKTETGRSHGELVHASIKSIIESVSFDLSMFDAMKGSMRAYFAGKLVNRLMKVEHCFEQAVRKFKADGSHYSLTDEGRQCITQVGESLASWREKLRADLATDGQRIADELSPADQKRYDYWVSEFLKVMTINEYTQPFDQYLIQHNVNIELLQQQAQEAVSTMDTDALTKVTKQMTEAKSAAEGILTALYKPLLITDEQTASEPKISVPESVASLNDDGLLDDLEETITRLETELGAEKSRRTQLGKDLAKATTELEDVKKSAGDFTPDTSDAFLALVRGSTPLAVVEAFKALSANHVVVLDSALASAKKSTFKNATKLMESLILLAGEYYNQIILEGKPDSVAKDVLATTYRAGESDTTISVPKLRAQREFKYEGETVLFAQHLTIGVKRGNHTTIQVHFKIIDKKLVIARVGTHLDVASG